MNYYVYAYLREDGSPYYIGKGKGRRAWSTLHSVKLPADSARIVMIETNLTDAEAIDLEVELIKKHGRKDLGTGILRNMTDGGDGQAGRICLDETRNKIGKANTGKPSSMKGKKNPGLSASLKGKPKSLEHVKKLSVAKKGKPQPHVSANLKGRPSGRKGIPQEKITCPHCGKVGGYSPMKQWHFDNCKHKE